MVNGFLVQISSCVLWTNKINQKGMKNAFCAIAWVLPTTSMHHGSRHFARIGDMTKQLFLLCLTRQRAFSFALCRRHPAFSHLLVRVIVSFSAHLFLNSTFRAKAPAPTAEGAYSGFNFEQASVVRQMSVPFEYFKAAGELPPRGSGFRAAEAAAENTKSMLAAFAGSSGLSRMKCVLRRFLEDLGMDFRMLPGNKLCSLSAFI